MLVRKRLPEASGSVASPRKIVFKDIRHSGGTKGIRSGDALAMEVGPDDRHRHDPGFSRAGRHLEGVAAKIFGGQVLNADFLLLRNVSADLALAIDCCLEFDGF